MPFVYYPASTPRAAREEDPLQARAALLDEREARLDEREARLNEREAQLDQQEGAFAEQVVRLVRREAELAQSMAQIRLQHDASPATSSASQDALLIKRLRQQIRLLEAEIGQLRARNERFVQPLRPHAAQAGVKIDPPAEAPLPAFAPLSTFVTDPNAPERDR